MAGTGSQGVQSGVTALSPTEGLHRWSQWLLYVLALIGTALPWLNSGSAALNHNLIDLAEWTSLHPGAPAEFPAYLTPLLLRLTLVCIALLIGWQQGNRTERAVAVAFIAFTLLPPFEFLSALDNANYRQQAALALVALVMGLMGLTAWASRFRRPALLTFAVTAPVVAAFGLIRALALRSDYLPETQLGFGIVVTVAALGLLILLITRGARSPTKKAV